MGGWDIPSAPPLGDPQGSDTPAVDSSHGKCIVVVSTAYDKTVGHPTQIQNRNGNFENPPADA